MRMPELTAPERYTGLYVFDFGGQVAVGYTAEEIAILLESQRYADGKVYRIHRALPDGTMELQGVPRERFQMEDGLFFYRARPDTAQADFDELARFAATEPPPCRMKVQLARWPAPGEKCATAVIFPAEFTHDVAEWLNRIGFEGGDVVEGGPSQVSSYYAARPVVADRRQLWPAAHDARPAEEVLATTHLPVQRRFA